MRTLALSLGNTSIFAGVFAGERLVKSFRLPSAQLATLPRRVGPRIDTVGLCSVVPALTPETLRLIRRTWSLEARVLTADAPHGLKIGYRRPRELGTDRLAAAIGAQALFPRRDVIVVDCGTATTVTALRRDGVLLGGVIFPGATLWAEMLATRTAQLPRVPLARRTAAIGRSPREGIASGIFFGQAGAIRETVAQIRREAFGRRAVAVIGTGGHAPWFAREKLFTQLEPDLILRGLRAFAMSGRSA